eukprot:92762_1
MSFDEQTIIIVASVIGIIFVIIILATCYCVYYFWKKNKKLVNEQKKEEQPLNHNGEAIHDDPTAADDPTNPNNHPRQSGMKGIAVDPRMMVHMPNNPANTPYSQEETTNSSDYPATNGFDPNGFDANFLVHPEQYLSASQTSNSGNGSNGNLKGFMGTANMAMKPHPLNTATVTSSQSLSGPQQSNRNPMVHSMHNVSNMHNMSNNPTLIKQSVSPNNRRVIPHHIQEMHRKLADQKHRLHDIVRNARNKLQLIDSKHISFEYEVGRGKFGKVFRALWTDSTTKQQKTVAVKWFKQDEVDQEVFEDFLKEISVAAHLPPHENVLQIYGFCISPYALVTEYVNGGSVEICVSTSNQASSRSQIRIGDVVQMFIDTAKGISHLHTVNIIHRDVAARNLLIEDMENNPNIAHPKNMSTIAENTNHEVTRRVVVCDFGLSRITQNPDGDNMTNSHIGPLKWMSPESIRQQIYNSKTDVYSFGVVMWEVLCGMPPYPQTKVLSLAVEVISKQTRPAILPWFPRPLQILMQRCWQEIPEFRPTFEDIKNELELFKQELISNDTWKQALTTCSASELKEQNKTKEKLRSLHELVSNYLAPNKYHWDRLIQPKLIQLIRDYERQQQARNDPLSLMNNVSEPQNQVDIDYDMYDTQQENNIAIVQQMNVSNKRIQMSDVDEADMMDHQRHNLPVHAGVVTHPGHRADVSVSIKANELQRNSSLSPTQNTQQQQQDTTTDHLETASHRLGDSVQIDMETTTV